MESVQEKVMEKERNQCGFPLFWPFSNELFKGLMVDLNE